MAETITARMAQWATKLAYGDVGERAVHEAKRYLLDSLGCAFGGYRQEDAEIALGVLEEIGGEGTATVIGSGSRTDPVSAALANALMVRVMDYNDIYWQQDPSHPSDIIPAAMACGERARGDGKELIVGIVLGHEFEMRLCEAAFPGIRERGWHHATLTAFVSPIVAARMLGLSWEQCQHAIGISASRHATLGAVTAGKLTMVCWRRCWPSGVTRGRSTSSTAKRGWCTASAPSGSWRCWWTGWASRGESSAVG
jgi:2-methylcitrate dehydratase